MTFIIEFQILEVLAMPTLNVQCVKYLVFISAIKKSSENVKILKLNSIIYFRAFVGPSLGGFLLDEFGFRNASMALLVLEIVLVSTKK